MFELLYKQLRHTHPAQHDAMKYLYVIILLLLHALLPTYKVHKAALVFGFIFFRAYIHTFVHVRYCVYDCSPPRLRARDHQPPLTWPSLLRASSILRFVLARPARTQTKASVTVRAGYANRNPLFRSSGDGDDNDTFLSACSSSTGASAIEPIFIMRSQSGLSRSGGGGGEGHHSGLGGRPVLTRSTVDLCRDAAGNSTRADAARTRLLQKRLSDAGGNGGGDGGGVSGGRTSNLLPQPREQQANYGDMDDSNGSDMSGMVVLPHPKRSALRGGVGMVGHVRGAGSSSSTVIGGSTSTGI